MRLDAPGGPRETRGYRRGGLTSPTLWNGMLLDFLAIFRLFFAIFRDFRHSSSVCMHLGALWTQENTGGVSWHIQPFIIACYFDFSAIFRLFYVFFMHLRSCRNTGEAKRTKGYFSQFILYIIINILHFAWYPYGYLLLRMCFGSGRVMWNGTGECRKRVGMRTRTWLQLLSCALVAHDVLIWKAESDRRRDG